MSKAHHLSSKPDRIEHLKQKIQKITSDIVTTNPESAIFSLSLEPTPSTLRDTSGLSGENLEIAKQRNKIKRLSALIKFLEKYHTYFEDHVESLKQEIKDIISSDPSFAQHEMKDQIAIARHSVRSLEEDVIDANLTTRIISSTNTSMVNELIASVPLDLSLEIINHILDLEDVISLGHRKEIIPIFFDQRILSGVDFLPIIRKLVAKGINSIQKDYSDNIASNERAVSGSNSLKIAQIFFE